MSIKTNLPYGAAQMVAVSPEMGAGELFCFQGSIESAKKKASKPGHRAFDDTTRFTMDEDAQALTSLA